MRGWRKGWGGEGIKVSSLGHEEQHLRWLGQEQKGCQRTWSAHGLSDKCRSEPLSWVLGVAAGLIPGFRPRQATGQGRRPLRVK